MANCGNTKEEKVHIGSVIKMSVNFGYQGSELTLDDLDTVTLTYFSPISKSLGVSFTKDDLIRRDTGSGVEWFAIVDTSLVGKGQMKLRVDAMIPDADVPEVAERREVEETETNVTII